MVNETRSLLAALTEWVNRDESVQSAVLFGSHARPAAHAAAADSWSDIDLHLITNNPQDILAIDWAAAVPGFSLDLKVSRAATGGVKKLSLLFSAGEADLVLVPTTRMRFAKIITRLHLQRRFPDLEAALNSFATVMSGGYVFLKGERKWGAFYAEIVKKQPGFRISDDQAKRMAEDYVYDLLWVMKKLQRGELIAAQRTLHKSLLETNITLLHELRLRQGKVTFQQARRVERLLTPPELERVTVSSPLDGTALLAAAKRNFEGLCEIMVHLLPAWRVPTRLSTILSQEIGPTER